MGEELFPSLVVIEPQWVVYEADLGGAAPVTGPLDKVAAMNAVIRLQAGSPQKWFAAMPQGGSISVRLLP